MTDYYYRFGEFIGLITWATMAFPLQDRHGHVAVVLAVKHSRSSIANSAWELSKCISSPAEAALKEMLRIIQFVLGTSENKGLKIQEPTRTVK